MIMEHTAKLRVLIADDNRATAYGYGKFLELRGYEVKVVLNGLAALDEVRTFRPDALLLDVRMPGMSGFDVVHAIRQQPGFESTLIIIVSGCVDAEETIESNKGSADYYLLKPIDLSELERTLIDWSEARLRPASESQV